MAITNDAARPLDKSKPYWWRRLTDSDPISLEPLRRLRVEPFELANDSSHSTYFDGRILANYLVSTGAFTHPISRRELTSDDCRRLDEHLRNTNSAKACVLQAFENKDQYNKRDSPENVIRQLQQEADLIMRSLYESSSLHGRSDRERRGDRNAEVHELHAGEISEFDETVPLGGASVTSVEDFPTLTQNEAPATAPPTSLIVSQWSAPSAARVAERRMAEAHTANARPEEYPTLGGAPSTANPSFASGRWGANSATHIAVHSSASLASGGIITNGFHVAAPPAAQSAPPAPSAPPVPADFPVLGGGKPATSVRPIVAAAWSRDHPSVVSKAPTTQITATASVASSPAPAVPQSYEAQPADFPTLVGVTQPNGQPTCAMSLPRSREELIARNKVLLNILRQASDELRHGNEPDAMREFKRVSAEFQKGQLDGQSYLSAFRSLFGDATTLRVFPEVIALLPDSSKRADLSVCFDTFQLQPRPFSGSAPVAPQGEWARRSGAHLTTRSTWK